MNYGLEKMWKNGTVMSLMWSCCLAMCMKGLNETTENPYIVHVLTQLRAQSITASLTFPVVCSALGVRRRMGLVAIS
jgi:hypothetical protein